jgi:hypothetical protein
MTKRLKVKLYEGWRPGENKDGPATYLNGNSCLQFSQAIYKKGALPITSEGLIALCEKLTKGVRGRRDLMSASGNCEHGAFGTVLARGDQPAFVQVWVLSNGTEYILVTHSSESEPTPKLIAEAGSIALMTTLGPSGVQ